jgi:FkbM family methyltransferase
MAARAAPRPPRAHVQVGYGPARGLRLPARGVAPTHPQARLLLTGTLEVAVQQALRRTILPGAVMWDVGANLGFFALLAARLAGPDGRVVAFEPVPAAAALAREAASLNGLADRIVVRPEALGAVSAWTPLCVVGEPSWSHLADRGRHPATRQHLEVEVATADGLIEAGLAPAPDVLKLDVEGSEVDVLRGAQGLLERHRPVVVCELHDTAVEVADLLEGAGYTLESLDGPGPVRDGTAVHVLARPAGLIERAPHGWTPPR